MVVGLRWNVVEQNRLFYFFTPRCFPDCVLSKNFIPPLSLCLSQSLFHFLIRCFIIFLALNLFLLSFSQSCQIALSMSIEVPFRKFLSALSNERTFDHSSLQPNTSFSLENFLIQSLILPIPTHQPTYTLTRASEPHLWAGKEIFLFIYSIR